MFRLIVGLGNPGDKYQNTRHNVGFMVVNALAEKYGGKWKTDKKFEAELCEVEREGEKIWLLKPQTFMNISGKSVSAILNYYDIDLADLCIIYDDKDMEFGKIRFRQEGGSGGHNGIKSITEHLGTEEFPRLKIGVANELTEKMDTADFVLTRFSKEEQEELPQIIEEVVLLLEEKI